MNCDFFRISLILITYKEKFANVCQQMFDLGISKHEDRVKEVDMFWECMKDAKNENKDVGTERINEFMSYKKSVCSINRRSECT